MARRTVNRRDANEGTIAQALRAWRWTVLCGSQFGMPVDLVCFDGLVMWPKGVDVEALATMIVKGMWTPEVLGSNRVWFAEVKDPSQDPSHRRLTRAGAEFLLRCTAPGAIVLTPQQAIECGQLCRGNQLDPACVAATRYIRETGGIG